MRRVARAGDDGDVGPQALRGGDDLFEDHIHILCVMAKNLSIGKLIEEIKTSSSKWIKTKGIKISRILLATWLWRIFSQF